MNADSLVRAWNLSDEATGLLLQKVLEDRGIRSELKSEQIAWMDDIMKTARGHWGSLLVWGRDLEGARRIIKEYLGQRG